MRRRLGTCCGLLVALLFCGCGPAELGAHGDRVSNVVPRSELLSLTPGGVASRNITISVGTRLVYANNDSVPHQIVSDPHPLNTDCPELNGPPLNPGDQFTATVVPRATPCGFHDQLNPSKAAFQGSITVKP